MSRCCAASWVSSTCFATLGCCFLAPSTAVAASVVGFESMFFGVGGAEGRPEGVIRAGSAGMSYRIPARGVARNVPRGAAGAGVRRGALRPRALYNVSSLAGMRASAPRTDGDAGDRGCEPTAVR